jgi:hypothetical protein
MRNTLNVTLAGHVTGSSELAGWKWFGNKCQCFSDRHTPDDNSTSITLALAWSAIDDDDGPVTITAAGGTPSGAPDIAATGAKPVNSPVRKDVGVTLCRLVRVPLRMPAPDCEDRVPIPDPRWRRTRPGNRSAIRCNDVQWIGKSEKRPELPGNSKILESF